VNTQSNPHNSSDGTRSFNVAVLAIGGQGGGVLTNWLVAVAESCGWRAQSTSVPGVAQRTGATIYYIEMVPESIVNPVLALMPSPGDVDLVIAAELMEAGRAIQRGLVSPDRTTLVASSHRAFAVSEKAALGDGAADPAPVLAAAHEMSKRFVCADMAVLAERHGSVISASLFGAVAAAGTLPFPREAFEATIRDGGVGVGPSLDAFAAGFEAVSQGDDTVVNASPAARLSPTDDSLAHGSGIEPARTDVMPGELVGGTTDARAGYQALCARINVDFVKPAHAMLMAGLDAVVDYQDVAYGEEYLDLVAALQLLDKSGEGANHNHQLTTTAAKYVAGAMIYDDVIRVADLKTREARFDRLAADAKAGADTVVHVTEFMHPRLEEVCGTLPVAIGSAIESSTWVSNLLRPLIDRGRRVRTDSLHGFLMLYALGGMRRWRRASLRHSRELTHREHWLKVVRDTVGVDYALAVETLKTRRLIKGYSDTHARGESKFDRIIDMVPILVGRSDAAPTLAGLRKAAMAGEGDTELASALSSARSAAAPATTH
jgi:indolepyruvate ferredoxin oxidoreductase beta subunit